jgi:Cytochrome c7 and related cytochrome c
VGLARVSWLCFALVACSAPRVAEAPLPPIDPTRLSHTIHARIACTSCHTMGKRPGAEDHKPCDDCHRKAFVSAPGELCKVCHTDVTAGPLSAPLKPYPIEDIWEHEPSRFSHRAHLDAGRVESLVGFHVTCADCHVRDGKLARPDHATCARCHAAEASLPGLVQMPNCTGCHAAGTQLRTRARLIRGDLHFSHDTHKTDRRGTVIRCEQCHKDSAAATDYQTHAAPQLESCVTCHDDSDRAPEAVKMRRCGACHAGRAQTLTTLAPRNHLPATEKPIDHTIAFRRDHAEAAERDSKRCATCHTQMSGNALDTCDECHQTMKPADHRITFRELDHGPEAAADRTRCARCHVVNFCTACHSQRPRSHGFIGEYVNNHAMPARENVRACLTCHDGGSGTTCDGAGCHPADRLRSPSR